MISDVLADAGVEIERYLREMPDTYADCLPEVLHVLRTMDELRQKLDTPPTPAEMAAWREKHRITAEERTPMTRLTATIWEFLGLVWRASPAGGRVALRTAWRIARLYHTDHPRRCI